MIKSVFRKIVNAIKLLFAHKNKYYVQEKNVLYPLNNSPGKYIFYCPGCKSNHLINTNFNGHQITGKLNKPTVKPSVLSKGNAKLGTPNCHSYITDGKIEFLPDCTHELAGKTVDLRPID
jgi:hypothetical protein